MPDVLGSRNGDSDPAGKLTEQVSLSLTPRTLEAVTTLAVLNGIPRGEYLRKIVDRHCFGELPIAKEMYARGRPESTVRIHPDRTVE